MMSAAVKQPTYKRQRFLLSFLQQLNESVSATDLQKLVFLYMMDNHADYYDFIPYKYGAYSFQLREDLDILERDGYVIQVHNQDGTKIKANGNCLTESNYQIAPERGNALIRRAYRMYPYYAIKSEITSRLFRGQELDRFNQGKQAYIQTEQVLFTIGYEAKGIEAFMNILIQNDVRLLCDVRKNPLSRKFGFSKGKLEHILQTIGIKYVHIPGLGIDSDKRCLLETAEDYERLFDFYKKTLPSRQAYLDEVYGLLQQSNRIALMCYELEPTMCHRHVVRDYIVEAYQIRSADL